MLPFVLKSASRVLWLKEGANTSIIQYLTRTGFIPAFLFGDHSLEVEKENQLQWTYLPDSVTTSFWFKIVAALLIIGTVFF
mmetsp:Transcript_33062/g.50714  ORF Transcript_33062/g.50714 Transcript_33062/m.50714 type:complete len:81 (-) Transcript_33062:437-679(-)